MERQQRRMTWRTGIPFILGCLVIGWLVGELIDRTSPDPMKYVVYGAGAVGGVIGGHLHLAGLDTTLVARGEHLEAIRRDGLLLDIADGAQRLEIPAAASAREVAWTDDTVVLLTVKSHQTAAALDDIASHASPDTVIVSAQNGVANERAVLRRFAAAYGITVMLPATHLEPGVVVQKCFPTPGHPRHRSGARRRRRHGRVDRGRSPEGRLRVGPATGHHGLEAPQAADEPGQRRRRRVRARATRPTSSPGAPATRARPRSPPPASPSCRRTQDRERRGDILRARPSGRPPRGGSTWQSITRGGASEIDYLSGEVVLLGRLYGVPTPVNELVQRTTTELAISGGAARSRDAAAALAALD